MQSSCKHKKGLVSRIFSGLSGNGPYGSLDRNCKESEDHYGLLKEWRSLGKMLQQTNPNLMKSALEFFLHPILFPEMFCRFKTMLEGDWFGHIFMPAGHSACAEKKRSIAHY